MQHHLTLRGVQQSLGVRGIRVARDGTYPDGRSRYAVWPSGGRRAMARHTDDVDMAYIVGLRMTSRGGPSGCPAYA